MNLVLKVTFDNYDEWRAEFDSHEAYGKFNDKMMDSEFWTGIQAFINEGYPDVKYISTDVYYSMI